MGDFGQRINPGAGVRGEGHIPEAVPAQAEDRARVDHRARLHTAPSAASRVKAATVSAVAAMAVGIWTSLATRSASKVKITDQAATRTVRNKLGDLLCSPGHCAGQHHGGGEYCAKCQDQFGQSEPAPQQFRSLRLPNSTAPPRPNAR